MSTTSYNRQLQICRLCLAPTATCFSLVAGGEISTMLEALTSLKILPEDDISTIACLKCVLNLKLGYIIQQNMLGAEQRFRLRELHRMIKPETSDPVVIKEEIIEEEHVDQEIKFDSGETLELYYCDICGSALSSQLRLERHKFRFHLNKNEPEEQVKVKVFKENIQSKVSSILRQIPELFACEICGTTARSQLKLRQHKKDFHTSTRCLKCDKFIPTWEFKLHVATHAKNGGTHVQSVDTHVEKVDTHVQKVDTHVETNEKVCETEIFKCRFCEKVFKYAVSKCKHELKCTGEAKKPTKADGRGRKKESYTCDVCGEITPSRQQMHRHKYNTHLRKTCPVCHESVAKDNYRRHAERHKNILTICEMCGASVKSTNLKAHIRINHKAPSLKCKFCDRLFKHQQLLVYHQKKEHLNQADFVCDTCGKTFFRGRYLQKHIHSKHLKLRPHICKFCKVGFSTRYAMMTHQRKHTNETPYKCEVCGEGFRYKVTLKAHLKSKHDVEDELTCECKVCGKKFASAAALVSHGRIH